MRVSELDKTRLEELGISPYMVEEQLKKLEKGMHFIRVERAATPGDGIYTIDREEREKWISEFEDAQDQLDIVKFVPASGAATRMFRDLQSAISAKMLNTAAKKLLDRLEDFPFYELLARQAKKEGVDIEIARGDEDYLTIIRLLLEENELNLGQTPKGLLPFHKYKGETRTAFEEQWAEAFEYAVGKDKKYHLHFTVSPEHREGFESLLEKLKHKYSSRSMEAVFSHQASFTDTVAIDEDGDPVRKSTGELFLRPGGHGALLQNLDTIDADIVFIKNIDNVQPRRLQEEVAEEKRLLGGLCLYLREASNTYIRMLRSDQADRPEVKKFIRKWFQPGYEETGSKELIEALDRPIRVCGMVINDGEPGGGPFWVDGSLQIVEKSQIDPEDSDQANIVSASTHFNPVDVVCAYRNPDGNPYNLSDYVDEEAYITAEKSFEGRDIRVLEHPGLWNGAMAGWNTVFVEVPGLTFSPVKTIFDLLRKSHRT